MDIFCWNIRGLNDKIKRRGVRKWLKKHRPLFGGLVETHVDPVKASYIINNVFPGWRFECNYEFSDLGKVWLLWHPSVSVSICHKSLQSITGIVKLPLVKYKFAATIVYASNCRVVRKQLWSDISFLASSPQLSHLPWTVLGDFNQTLNAAEHSLGDQFSSPRGLREFSQCIASAKLTDLPYTGNYFTWSNKQGDSLVSKKLDRILVNDEWLASFPSAKGVFGDPGVSDHSPCSIILDTVSPKVKRPFKFYSMLNLNPEFTILIRECWKALSFEGSKMLRVSKKLKELKSVIRSFSRENFSNLEKRVNEAFEELQACQRLTLNTPSPAAANSVKNAHERWSVLAKAEESFLQQRSKVNWLGKGDCGSAFYHRSICTRQSFNLISCLLDENGSLIEVKADIENHIIKFYENLLGGEQVPSAASFSELEALMPLTLDDTISSTLSAPFSDESIREVFFNMPKNKSPGPDGYPAEFFTCHWNAVGRDVTEAVQEFFNSGCLLQQWNTTILTLIPKKASANKITDFRPISCCNTVYKAVSKLLADRLKSVLPSLISNSQSAFIPGRLLVENVLMATELIQGYNWKHISRRSMLKVDLKKAFDSVNWSFIVLILRVLGFPEFFVNLIYQCIATTRFSVAINGELCGYFKGSRGLRQGDPLSPYLFVLAMEVFSQLINKEFSSGLIGYHPAATDPTVTHLAFADDIMIFFDGQSGSLQQIVATLERFASWSGLTVNRSKSELYSAGLNPEETLVLRSHGFSIGSLPVRYLGLPLMHKKLRISDYRPLLDQLKIRFSSWSSRALSFAGRRQLISSVIYGTLNFWFTSFLLPKGCIQQVESLCSRFLWNGDITSRAAARVSWRTCCLPKSEGGLGLRDFYIWNQTLVLKLIWLLFRDNESLWASWCKNHRLKQMSLWSLDHQKQGSWIWKTLLKLRPFAERFLRCQIGDGQLASFWFDHWTPMGPLIKFLGPTGPRMLGIPLHSTVSESCTPVGWTLRHARSSEAEILQLHLCTVPLPSQSHLSDMYGWEIDGEVLANFSSKLTWESLRNRQNVVPWNENVWFKGAIPSHAFMMWMTNLDRLPTRSRTVIWGVNLVDTCCVCNVYAETRDHLFLRCEFSEQIWILVTARLGYQPCRFHTWTAFMEWLGLRDSVCTSTLRRLAAQATVYSLWWERNNRLHNSISSPIAVTYKKIDRLVRNAILARKERKNFRNLMIQWLKHD
ncbi:Reverse transcriptase zinc-binding domain-containing protein [Hirschfeldia incana]|nr:Reverse transcriptase zinc-binding domain-containing protein [Hirschfeldia incana]